MLAVSALCVSSFLGYSVPANALNDDENNDDQNEVLELYPTDGGEPCILGTLQIRVQVNHVTKVGIMKLELYNSEDGFLNKKGRMRSIRVAAEDGPQMICINVPEPGVYAIAGYHDLDGDRKLDKRWDFTPDEPYGLSNNPVIKKRRIPKFEEAQFDVGIAGENIVINLVDLRKNKDKNDDD